MSEINDNENNIGEIIKEAGESWWDKAKKLVKKNNPKIVIDESDPEYDAQKIYQHWLKSFK